MYQSPEGATPDFQRFGDQPEGRFHEMYQSPEGATPDFQPPLPLSFDRSNRINPPKGPRPISSLRQRRSSRVSLGCINPPKGPRPISSTVVASSPCRFRFMYQSPEGATPDFQRKWEPGGSSRKCINPPKGPRPISSCGLVAGCRRRYHGINPPKGPRPISRVKLSPSPRSLQLVYQSPEGATPDFQRSKK